MCTHRSGQPRSPPHPPPLPCVFQGWCPRLCVGKLEAKASSSFYYLACQRQICTSETVYSFFFYFYHTSRFFTLSCAPGSLAERCVFSLPVLPFYAGSSCRQERKEKKTKERMPRRCSLTVCAQAVKWHDTPLAEPVRGAEKKNEGLNCERETRKSRPGLPISRNTVFCPPHAAWGGRKS